ncbi:hypothetical protein SAMN03159496_06604 [Rhizobium sp. NFR07]|nr:hypothetical protein SAMN03159496_06604 [Rhizobium sp. NFR07]
MLFQTLRAISLKRIQLTNSEEQERIFAAPPPFGHISEASQFYALS